MVTTQNFDFINQKVQVTYIEFASATDTGYISRFVFLKEDPTLVAPPPAEGGTIEPLDTLISFTYKYDMDVDNFDNYPELINYFYKTTHKSIDVLTVGDITDISDFITTKWYKTMLTRVKTVVVDSSLDDETIDKNFTMELATLVTRGSATSQASESGGNIGRLIIENEDKEIRTAELLKFAGWLFNRSDFLGQVSIRALDYPTTYWLDYNGLTNCSDNKNIGFGNQAGTTLVSCFFIGNHGGMNYYREEEVKRDLQNANLKLLQVNNTYNQTLIDLCESTAKNSINSHSYCNKKKTYVKHMKMSDIPQEFLDKKIIPMEITVGFFEEVDHEVIELYNISSIYRVGA